VVGMTRKISIFGKRFLESHTHIMDLVFTKKFICSIKGCAAIWFADISTNNDNFVR
jgi:hypothetical protein